MCFSESLPAFGIVTILYIFKRFIYLFIYLREREKVSMQEWGYVGVEGEEERESQADSLLSSELPKPGSIPRS